VIIPVDEVVGAVEKYQVSALLKGDATQLGVAWNAVEKVCAVVTVPEELVTYPTWTFGPSSHTVPL
jgi:hypothetical protein